MPELTLKNELLTFSLKKRYSALCGDEVIAHIVVSTDNDSFKFSKRAYKVEFNDGQVIEFVQKAKPGIGNVEYDVYQDEFDMYHDKTFLGNISKEPLKPKYNVQLNGTGIAISAGNFLEKNIRYTNVLSDEISIRKGLSPLSRWTITSENEISQVDTAIGLFLRAMSELIQ